MYYLTTLLQEHRMMTESEAGAALHERAMIIYQLLGETYGIKP